MIEQKLIWMSVDESMPTRLDDSRLVFKGAQWHFFGDDAQLCLDIDFLAFPYPELDKIWTPDFWQNESHIRGIIVPLAAQITNASDDEEPLTQDERNLIQKWSTEEFNDSHLFFYGALHNKTQVLNVFNHLKNKYEKAPRWSDIRYWSYLDYASIAE